MSSRKTIVSLVERGWVGARECSLAFKGQPIEVIHVVKGKIPKSVMALIQPWPHIRFISIPRRLFWPLAWIVVNWEILRGRLRSALVDNERSFGRVRGWIRPWHRRSLDCLIVREGNKYELWLGRQRMDVARWQEACVR